MAPKPDIAIALETGGTAIVPTETVYGLAARADNAQAVDRIYQIKGRSFDKPLALCVKDMSAAVLYGQMSGFAKDLAAAFWPGPLSLVVKAKPGAPKLDARLYGENKLGEPTIALRCPQADWISLIDPDIPIALTSANPSGENAPRTLPEAKAYIGDKVDYTYNGADCAVGISSTIMTVEERGFKILRQGSIKAEDIAPFMRREA